MEQGAVVIGIAGAAAIARAQPSGTGAPTQDATPANAGGSAGAAKVAEASTAATANRWPGFQHQDPALVRDMVGASHRRVDRVRELLKAHPALANAAWDWGFGDWETALGAASHVGNREIAGILLEHGARLDVFAATMLGMTEVVKGILAAQPGLAKTRGPHGISLMAHAMAGENEAMIAYLKGIKEAGDTVMTPVTPEEMKLYAGAYVREAGAGKVIVTPGKSWMTIKAEGGDECRLTSTGDHTFHPAGAPNVRVVFSVQGNAATRVEVVEAEWMVSAMRQ